MKYGEAFQRQKEELDDTMADIIIYKLNGGSKNAVQQRVVKTVNSLRQFSGFITVAYRQRVLSLAIELEGIGATL